LFVKVEQTAEDPHNAPLLNEPEIKRLCTMIREYNENEDDIALMEELAYLHFKSPILSPQLQPQAVDAGADKPEGQYDEDDIDIEADENTSLLR
jgi:hypothetical protein